MMADQKDTGGDAFPSQVAITVAGDVYQPYPGMTLRDYFAGQAMAGLASKEANTKVAPERIARRAYVLADAMIEERKK